ncbi:hypothetical protein CKAH01_03961 [Colletotrichum kahawae]|uniref:Uncharacterized protein n=1 Tax=Colletotrichum kahawae TaxID=34407 RepID=A0AAD9YQ46_COLKA|nr:hypothetical protein CKAH01_03961 [Colletotrichum kahawae]
MGKRLSRHTLLFITHSCGTGGESPCLFLPMFACLPVNNSPANFASAYGKVSHPRPQVDKCANDRPWSYTHPEGHGEPFSPRVIDAFVHIELGLLSLNSAATCGGQSSNQPSLCETRHAREEKLAGKGQMSIESARWEHFREIRQGQTYHNRNPSLMSATPCRFAIVSCRPHRLLQLASGLPLLPCNAAHNGSVEGM